MEDTKQRILEKSLELFSTKGYDAVSVGEIAKAVGIKAPSLYNHFPRSRRFLMPLWNQRLPTTKKIRAGCPICGAKTRARLLPDTVLRNFPLFCSKCRQESIINAQNYHVIKIKPQPDAKTQC